MGKAERSLPEVRPARSATLLKQLILKKIFNNGEDVRDHLNNFMDVVDKLANISIDLNSDLLSVVMLHSLPSSYKNCIITVDSRDQLPSSEDLKIKIIAESEERRNINTGTRITNRSEGALY